jgi:myo-inositol catabolism protein IolC
MSCETRPLYILPFDHRGSFVTAILGFSGPLSTEHVARVAAAKQLIFEAVLEAIRDGVALDRAAILVDEQFGATILADAHARGLTTACPAEKSGQAEFAFEYGEEFAQHVEAMNPTYCKVLVRYNPEGDSSRNERQAAQLRRLSEYLHRAGRGFLFELLVPPEPAQLERVANESDAYDVEVRPSLMAAAIRGLQDAGVEPDIWKVEGLDRRDDAVEVVDAARRQGRNHVRCIVLGRHGEERRVVHLARGCCQRSRVRRVRRGAQHVLGSAAGDAGGAAREGRCSADHGALVPSLGRCVARRSGYTRRYAALECSACDRRANNSRAMSKSGESSRRSLFRGRAGANRPCPMRLSLPRRRPSRWPGDFISWSESPAMRAHQTPFHWSSASMGVEDRPRILAACFRRSRPARESFFHMVRTFPVRASAGSPGGPTRRGQRSAAEISADRALSAKDHNSRWGRHCTGGCSSVPCKEIWPLADSVHSGSTRVAIAAFTSRTPAPTLGCGRSGRGRCHHTDCPRAGRRANRQPR